MAKLNIELCPETGICSIMREDKTKIDLMPNEVADLRDASGDAERSKEILAQIDKTFCESLDSDELGQLTDEIK